MSGFETIDSCLDELEDFSLKTGTDLYTSGTIDAFSVVKEFGLPDGGETHYRFQAAREPDDITYMLHQGTTRSLVCLPDVVMDACDFDGSDFDDEDDIALSECTSYVVSRKMRSIKTSVVMSYFVNEMGVHHAPVVDGAPVFDEAKAADLETRITKHSSGARLIEYTLGEPSNVDVIIENDIFTSLTQQIEANSDPIAVTLDRMLGIYTVLKAGVSD